MSPLCLVSIISNNHFNLKGNISHLFLHYFSPYFLHGSSFYVFATDHHQYFYVWPLDEQFLISSLILHSYVSVFSSPPSSPTIISCPVFKALAFPFSFPFGSSSPSSTSSPSTLQFSPSFSAAVTAISILASGSPCFFLIQKKLPKAMTKADSVTSQPANRKTYIY